MVNDADGAVAEIAARQHGVITRSRAASEGLDNRAIRRRLQRGVMAEPAPGVLTLSGHPVTWRQRLTIATLASHGAGVISHRAAAQLHHLDGFQSGDRFVELTTTGRRYVRLPGAIVHRAAALDLCDRTTVGSIPVTGIARTLTDLGSVCPRDVVERALDSARRQGTSLRWLQMTAERLHGHGRPGSSTLLGLLADIEPGDRTRDSWFEKLVEQCLRSPLLMSLGLCRQFEVRSAEGRFVARVDLALPPVRLAVEAHSRAFHFGRRLESGDEDRDLDLSAQGWETAYLGYRDTERPDVILSTIESIALKRAAQLGIAVRSCA